MTDDPTVTPEREPQPAAEPTASGASTAEPTRSASEAWADVVARMNDLGAAVTTWTRAAADNPDNRRHLDDVRNGVNDMAKQADAAFNRVTSTDFGQQMKSGAGEAGQAIGDAAQKVSDAAAPHVATAFAGIAGVFGRAAQKVEEAAARQKESAATTTARPASEPPTPGAAGPSAAPAPRTSGSPRGVASRPQSGVCDSIATQCSRQRGGVTLAASLHESIRRRYGVLRGSMTVIRVRTISRWLAVAMLTGVLAPSAAWAAVVYKPLNDVSFSDASHGSMVGQPGAGGGVLSWTNNGGVSWHAQAAAPNLMLSGVASSISGQASAFTPNFDGTYKSSDFGITWVLDTPVLSRTVNFADVAYLAGGRRVVVGKAGAGPSAIIASSVNGAPWNKPLDFEGPVYPPISDLDPAPVTRASFTAIDAAPGGTVAWAVGYDWTPPREFKVASYRGLIYRTPDAGATWVSQTDTTTVAVTCVSAPSASTAFVGQQSRTLLRTRNGGTTWDRINLPLAQMSKVWAIDTCGTNDLLVVGDGGKIAWTSNASDTTPSWKSMTISPARLLHGAQMIDANRWIVVGDNETILRTSDAGKTWTGQTSPIAPTARFTTASGPHLLSSTTIPLAGSSNDGAGIGVARVELRIQRQDGTYWDGAQWSAAEKWIVAEQLNPAGGWDAWKKTVTLDTKAVGWLLISARATDGMGTRSTVLAGISSANGGLPSSLAISTRSNSSLGYGSSIRIGGTLRSGSGLVGQRVILQSHAPGTSTYRDTSYLTTTGTGGAFSFSVKPSSKTYYRVRFAASSGYAGSVSGGVYATPMAKLSRSTSWSSLRRSKTYYAKGYIAPRHATSDGNKVKIRAYKKRSDGKYHYVKSFTASYSYYSSSKSRYKAAVKLTSKGKWKLIAYHAADGYNAKTYGSTDYLSVK